MEDFSSAVSVDVKLAKKELQLLELRKRLKEHFRKELKKESGSIHKSSEEKKKLPYDNYGSFFGQSQPSIARKVIMESGGALEVQQSAKLRLMNSTASKAKPDLLVHRIEADKLKALRDYSSILSDETENHTSLSAIMRNANLKHPSSDMQTTEVAHQHKIPPSKVHSITRNNIEQDRKFPPACNEKLVRPTRKHQIPDGHKVSSWQSLIATKRKSKQRIDCVEPNKKAKVMQNRLQLSAKLQACNAHKASLSKSQSVSTKLQPGQENSKNANEMARKFQVSSQQKVLSETKTSKSNLQSQTQQQMRQGKELHRANKEKAISTQIRCPVRECCYDDDQVEMSYVSSLCQNLFRRNPVKHVNDDHDFSDDCMVSSFSDIEKEERRSAKIARKEDQTELLRIEQEEREKKSRWKAKKKKPQQN